MAKIKIDDVEYETEDFNQKQTELYNEILYAKERMNSHEYHYSLLKERTHMLAKLIVQAADGEDKSETS